MGEHLEGGCAHFEYTGEPEILTGDAYEERRAEVSDPEGVLALEENGYLIIRGLSQIIKVPLMITFYNQLDLVRAAVACAAEEFEEADYRRFNLSMCQFMDSIELAMYNA